MAVSSMRFGDLILAFTTSFKLRYSDKNGQAKLSAGFWHPVPPQGFRALGSIGVPDHSDPNGVQAALCVQAPDGVAALADPRDYEWIYQDEGTGATMYGSCWRPMPPAGYIALGDVFADNKWEKPSTADVVCVREDLVFGANAGQLLWNDLGSGGKYDFSAWQNITPTQYTDPTQGASRALIAANTLVGSNKYEQPQFKPEMNVLCLPLPAETGSAPSVPALSGRSRPAEAGTPVIDHTVHVPFTAVGDDGKALSWKMTNSPFYRIQRKTGWRLLLFNDNNTTADQTIEDSVTVGVETSTSQSFEVSTGVSVSAETGVGIGGLGATFSATVSVEFGYETSTSVSQLQSRTLTRRMVTPKQTASAMWVGSHTFQLLRADGSAAGAPLKFDADSFHFAQYPAPEGTQQIPARAQIIAKHSGMALDIDHASTDPGAHLLQWHPSSDNNQKFRLQAVGDGYYQIIVKHSGMALDIDYASTDPGAHVLQWHPGAKDNQKFRLDPTGDGYYQIIVKHSGMALDIDYASTDAGAHLLQWHPSKDDNQKFQLKPISEADW